MVVEHIFITTLEAPDALRLASQFLNSRGFVASAQSAFAVGGGGEGWNVLEMTRGKKSASKAKSAVEFPQTIRVEWDRGRVTVAASSFSPLEQQATRLGGGRARKRVARAQETILTGLVNHLQCLLERGDDPAGLTAACAAVEERLHADERARRRRNAWIAVTIVVLFVGLLVAIIVAASNRN